MPFYLHKDMTTKNTELCKARNIGDALAAALLGEYSRSEALGQWAADLKLPDNEELVERLKSAGIPIDKWVSIHNTVYSPNEKGQR